MSIENIIVRMPNWVGDLVMATPVLADLRKKFPKASITAMCRTPLSDLLEKDPFIDEIFSFQKIRSTFLRKEDHRDLLGKIQRGTFDLGVLLTNSFSSAWWFYQGGVKRRIGFRGSLRRCLLTDPIRRQEKKHQVDLYKDLLAPLGIERSGTLPRLFIDQKEVKEEKERLIMRGYTEGKKIVGLSPFAAYGPAKEWPLERFLELASKLIKEGLMVIIFSDSIRKDLPENVINLSGQTTLRELVSLISLCDCLVTNDSGPMHIASALNTPLIALFGATDPQATGPLRGDVINKNVACSPCFKRKCPIDFRCMMQITVEEVFQKVLKSLNV